MIVKTKHNIIHYFVTFVVISIKSLTIASMWILLGLIGYFIFQSKKSPLDLIVGLPLLIGSGGMVITNIYTVFLSLFSPTYNKAMCVICNY